MVEGILASRKKMRFSVAPAQPSGYFSDRDRSDADDDELGMDEEEEQVDEGSQRGQDLSESNGDEEDGWNEGDDDTQAVESNQERSESHGDDDGEDVGAEDGRREEENQSDHEQSESDGDGGDEERLGEEGAEGEEEENRRDRDPFEYYSDGEEGGGGGVVRKDSSVPPLAPPPPAAAIPNITLDEDMLDCSVCCFPLKPPIFQCEVGHVVCSSCRDKLAAAAEGGRCHVCCTVITGGYRRCHAMEQLVESIRRSCPNAPHGCTARTAHYDLHAHLQPCPHAQYRCPAAEACGSFVGSMAALLDHFTGPAHRWPCTTGVRAGARFVTALHDGFNVVTVVRDASHRQDLFILRVAREPYGRVITSFCLRPARCAIDSSSSPPPPPPEGATWEIHLWYLHHVFKGGKAWGVHSQDSIFRVASTDLSNGTPPPNPQDCFQFIVANCVQPDAAATVGVAACFTVK